MQVSRRINAPPQRVWEILIDTEQWPVWGPSVTAVDFPKRWIEAGSAGRIKTAIGLWSEFEITDFELMQYWGWKVAGLTATGHRLIAHGDEHCELVFELPFIALPYALICRQAANRIARMAEGEKEQENG
ncbi:Polyketide cyclase / dehydrase and lipid transport [Malonomonas rubra DSM 5091]|uniref:Polyketide cyclase / dehydrase and lipid transport n=1 Tax=Malonomonas rubra DSM 5091 TaxID=1122189 RepID=A0A1M6G372_MALRU|nr:SRPBCC family protein [Malonomonas rubra]SHJ04379.1 Polyketide cyclase / dehydrase and lipid transport [Malonomonas rubra DSM 5091]